MRVFSSLRLVSLSLSLSLVMIAGCRSSDGDDSPVFDAPPNGNDTKIQDIQNPDNRVPLAADVTVRGVVVTAIDTYAERADGTRVGNIYIEEPEGGEYSGVLVYGSPLDQVATLTVGDIIDVTGAAKTEFALPADTTGRTTTELEPGSAGAITLTRISAGTVPTAALVDAAAIDAMAQAGRDTEWEKWEGVLIRVERVTQTSNVSTISGEANFLHFNVTGGLELDTSLAAFPPGIMLGACFASVTGMGDYFFNHKLLPRNTADVVTGGTGCPPLQITPATVAEIQMGTATGAVELTNVVVTGVTFNRSNLFVQDAPAGAPFNGVYVYRGGATVTDLPPEIVIGATVNITGEVVEFMGLTEVNNPVVTFVAPPGALPTAAATTIADLNNSTTGEPLEGVLVRLTNVKVTAYDMVMQKITLSQGGLTILVDDDVYRHTPTVNDCYATFDGIFSYNTFDMHVNVLPRLATDIVPGGTCP